MIRAVTVTNNQGEALRMELSRPKLAGLNVKKIDGLGPPAATVNMTAPATLDGARFNSARVGARNIVLTLAYVPSPSVEDARRRTYRYFPIKTNVKLEIETDGRVVETTGYVESNEPDVFSATSGTTISVMCEDAYFKSSGQSGLKNVQYYGITPKFQFPFQNAWLEDPIVEVSTIEMGTFQEYVQRVIDYDGDVETGFTMTYHIVGDGAPQNPSFENVNTGEVITVNHDRLVELGLVGLQQGDDVVIKTIPGQKSAVLIRQGVTHDILHAVAEGMSWLTLKKGANEFLFSATQDAIDMRLDVTYRDLYEGV